MRLTWAGSTTACICILIGLPRAMAQTPGFTATTSATPDSYGLLTVTIRNRSKINITAVTIYRSCEAPGGTGATSSSVGFDAMTDSAVGAKLGRVGMPVSASRTFDLAAEESKCPGGIGVVFADGHGEGSPEGWKKILDDRRFIYSELLVMKKMIEEMPPQQPDFPKHLLALLDARREDLADPSATDTPHGEVDARDKALNQLLTPLRQSPDRAPTQLSDQIVTLRTLDEWIEPLQKAIDAEKNFLLHQHANKS